MANALYTYSMVKALFDEGRDYIDSFWPFLLRAIPLDKSPVDMRAAQAAIGSKYGLTVPIHSLNTIAQRAKHKKYLVEERGTIRLTDLGRKYVEGLETERDVERRVSELLTDACAFFNARGESLTPAQAKARFERVIASNLNLFDLIGESPAGVTAEMATAHDVPVLEYFATVEESKPALFATLRDVICGSVISTVLYGESIDDANRRFKDTHLYLDSNIAFRVMGLDHDDAVGPAQEVVALIRKSGDFKLHIFDFTVAEMIGLLRIYSERHGQFVSTVPVNTIFSALKLKGISVSMVSELIANIDSELGRHGITVIKTGISLRDYETDPQEMSRLERYKPDQPTAGKIHDCAAVQTIAKFRRGEVRKIEHAKHIFLTADMRLARYAHIERGHEENGTISEVIPDLLLTNLLWLKDPTSVRTASLNAIISIHSRDLFVDRVVWDRFRHTVTDVVRSGATDEKNVSILLYDPRLQEALRLISPDDVSAIDEAWVLHRIEAAHQMVEQEQDLAIEMAKDAASKATAAAEAGIQLELRAEIHDLMTQGETVKTELERAKDQMRENLRQQAKKAWDKSTVYSKRTVLLLRSVTLLAIGLTAIYLFAPITALYQKYDKSIDVVSTFSDPGAPRVWDQCGCVEVANPP